MASRCSSHRTSMIILNSDSLLDFPELFFFPLRQGLSSRSWTWIHSVARVAWTSALTPWELRYSYTPGHPVLWGAGDGTRGPVHAGQTLHNWATSQPSGDLVACYLANNSWSCMSFLFCENTPVFLQRYTVSYWDTACLLHSFRDSSPSLGALGVKSVSGLG